MSRSPALIARGLGPHAAVRLRRLHLHRSVHRARRRRYRPERHRRHAHTPRGDGVDGSVLRIPRSACACATPTRVAFRTLADLAGRRVGTLGGTIAYEILLRAEREHGLTAVSYDDDVHPYTDLLLGRLDAVLLDNVLAERRRKTMPGFTIQPDAWRPATTSASSRRERAAPRRHQRDPARRDARRDARADLPKWGVWNDDQPPLYARVIAGDPLPPVISGLELTSDAARESRWDARARYLPALLRASVVTLVFSCLSMALAVDARRADRERPRVRQPARCGRARSATSS